MKTYARIADGRIAEPLVDYDGPIADHFGDQPGWIDVTAVSPRPAEGSTTADGGKTFSAPVVVAPVPEARRASTYQLMSALTDAQRTAYQGAVKPWDQRLFSARDRDWPEGNEKIARIATALGTTPAAWFDVALNPAAS